MSLVDGARASARAKEGRKVGGGGKARLVVVLPPYLQLAKTGLQIILINIIH